MEIENAKKSVWTDVTKTVIGIVIGLLVAHFIHNEVLAIRDDKTNVHLEK